MKKLISLSFLFLAQGFVLQAMDVFSENEEELSRSFSRELLLQGEEQFRSLIVLNIILEEKYSQAMTLIQNHQDQFFESDVAAFLQLIVGKCGGNNTSLEKAKGLVDKIKRCFSGRMNPDAKLFIAAYSGEHQKIRKIIKRNRNELTINTVEGVLEFAIAEKDQVVAGLMQRNFSQKISPELAQKYVTFVQEEDAAKEQGRGLFEECCCLQ